MPKSQKPIVAIFTSLAICDSINIRRYLNHKNVAAIGSPNETFLDYLIHQWCRENKIEFISYPKIEKIFDDQAEKIRDEELINFSDVVMIFTSPNDDRMFDLIKYAKKLDRKVFYHIIKT